MCTVTAGLEDRTAANAASVVFLDLVDDVILPAMIAPVSGRVTEIDE